MLSRKQPFERKEDFFNRLRKMLGLYFYDCPDRDKYLEQLDMSMEVAKRAFENQNIFTDLKEAAQGTMVPSLLIPGVQDVIVPYSAAIDLHLALSNSKCLSVNKAIHLSWIEQPETFMRFPTVKYSSSFRSPDSKHDPRSPPCLWITKIRTGPSPATSYQSLAPEKCLLSRLPMPVF
eukprot:gb/GECG01000980.1/.p1 GENE.gb/GECG01000980.1/~~gb/GECG01000980.1/.p1  ORF type:complete len:177 (+),score=10.94 gb/GECG01000980.1/:1-531(+)